MGNLVGKRLGNYQVLAALGRGGSGEVYRARDVVLGREVALKAVPSRVARDASKVARLDREARLLAALNHPNIAILYSLESGDFGRGERPFLVLELVPGEDLGRRLQAGRLAVDEALRIAVQIARALEAAHAKGIVHRDLKPANVMVTPSDTVKVLDFGIARTSGDVRRLDPAALARRMHDRLPVDATSGGLSGTVPYMSPEQIRNDEADPPVDVWAFGCVLYECLTGVRAFAGANRADTFAAIVGDDPDWSLLPAGLPAGIRPLLERCLAKDPAQRLQRIEGARLAVEDALAGRSHGGAPPASIAVLPFSTHGDAEQAYFGAGLAEDLIDGLARLPGLRVVPFGSARHASKTLADTREIGEKLRVGAVLEGSVRRAGDRLRVAAQLTTVADGYVVWSGRYDRRAADVFSLQDEMAAAIVAALEPALLGGGATVAPATSSLEAYELYLQGRHWWYQRTPAAVFAGIECFERAVRLDPGFARAYTGIADSYGVLRAYGVVPREAALGKARAAVERALQLDPALPEAHLSAGFFHLHLGEDWRTAEAPLRRAVESDPRSALAQVYYGIFLAMAQRPEAVRTQAEIACDLDPLSPWTRSLASLALFVAGCAESALEMADRALELQPAHPTAAAIRGLACCRLGRLDAALLIFERVVAASQRAPVYLGMLGLAHGLAGRLELAAAIAAEIAARETAGYVSPHCSLLVAIGLGDEARVERALERCRSDHTSALVLASTAGPFLDGPVGRVGPIVAATRGRELQELPPTHAGRRRQGG